MTKNYSVTFYKIQELANQKHMTISYLEQKCGLANGTIGKWKNRSVPNSDSISKVANYLNTTVDYLLNDEVQK